MNQAEMLAAVKSRPWFYRFPLPDGTETACDVGASVELLHETRRRMMLDFLGSLMEGDPWHARTALDAACHQGWFTNELGALFDKVQGIDKNAQSIEDARLMRHLIDPDGEGAVYFDNIDVNEWTGEVDFSLVFGLLYHTDNPVHVLRQVAKGTKRAILVETQAADGPHDERPETIEWGVAPNRRRVDGWFALVEDDSNREGGTSNLALVPTEAALHTVLRALGFQTKKLEPPADGHEALRTGARIMIAGVR